MWVKREGERGQERVENRVKRERVQRVQACSVSKRVVLTRSAASRVGNRVGTRVGTRWGLQWVHRGSIVGTDGRVGTVEWGRSSGDYSWDGRVGTIVGTVEWGPEWGQLSGDRGT